MSQRILLLSVFALCVVACGPMKGTVGEGSAPDGPPLRPAEPAAAQPGADRAEGAVPLGLDGMASATAEPVEALRAHPTLRPTVAPTCAPRTPERCTVTFSTPRGGEARAELRGTFDGWGRGAPMAARDGRWVADVELGHGSEVAYKFLFDGNDWRADPANPRRSSDVYGNSLLTVSCPPIPCTPVPGEADAGAGGGAGGGGAGGGGGGGEPGVCPSARPLGDFREETIYFLMTTRFFDGDASNNYYNRDRLELGDPTWRGDFKGLIEQLDYIHDTLGFTAIWITPVVENRSGLDYHGYHAYDFTRVDPRLESPGATFQDLICEVHRRGMRLVLDVVFNHSSNYGIRGQVHNVRAPIKYYREAGPFPSANPAHPYTAHLGDYRSPNREDDDNPLAPDVFRLVDPKGEQAIACPVCGGRIPVQQGGSGGYSGFRNHDPGHFFHAQVNRLDPVWYHQAGYMSGGDWESPYSLQQKHMAGDTMDLNTEHPAVKQYLIEAYKKYLDMGVDALRVDTVKHLERGNLLEYVNALKAHKPGLFVFGENLVKGTGWGTCIDGSDNGPAEIRPWWYTRTTNDACGGGRDDSGFSVLDFSLMSTFRDNISQGRFGGLSGVFNMDWLYGDASQLVTFIDNHDIGPQNDWKYRFAGSDQALASALNLIFLARGIPTVFYGTEIRFKAGLEVDGVDAPHAKSGRAYFGDHLLPGELDKTRAHPFVGHIKRLNQIRAASPALQKGTMEKMGENDNAFWFLRSYRNSSFAVVGMSQGGGTISVGGLKGGTWRDAVTGQSQQLGEGGTLTFHVKNGSAGVYLYEGPGKIGQDGAFLR